MDGTIHLEIWTGAVHAPVLRKTVNTAGLPDEEKTELQRLISESGAKQLPESLPASNLRDASHIKLVFNTDGTTQTVRIPNPSLTAPLRLLIDFIKKYGT